MEPKRSLPAKICYPIFWLYETKYWRVFIKKGLKDILEKAGINKTQETNLFGLFQIISVKNIK